MNVQSIKGEADQPDENHWVELARQGSERGWEELHRLYYKGLWSAVNQMLQDEALSEDVVQESFIKASNKLSQFRNDSKFSTWLYRITLNHAYDTLRKKTRQSRWLGLFPLKSNDSDDDETHELEPVDEHDAARAASLSDDRKAIEKALQSLGPDHRAVVELRLVQGFSTEETAKILGCRKGTVLSRLFYSLQKLKKTLGPTYLQQTHI